MVRRSSATSKELKGKLIAVEGLDGSGKSTQVYLLKRWFELSNLKIFFTEWSSSLLVKKATTKGKKQHLLTPTTFSLIHCTDFADRYERQILPLLQAGYIVLCDRYIFTALARDAVRGCDRTWLRRLYSFAVLPDITFLFSVPLDTAQQRLRTGMPHFTYHDSGMDLQFSDESEDDFSRFQESIQEEYKMLMNEFDINIVDGEKSINQLQEELREMVMAKIDLSVFRRRSRP